MKLTHSFAFDSTTAAAFLETVPRVPAVFALWPQSEPQAGVQPYLSRTRNLRHRLERLLADPRPGLRRLNLQAFTKLVEYQMVGSGFEAAWLLYQLYRAWYPRAYRQRLRLRPPAMLKVNLQNRFPRCYPTRRLVNDGSLYHGPFPSRAEAERFANEFLDLFKVRRCVEDLNPDPSHPGCIYSQMKMCLAPCFAGCTDEEYRHEVRRAMEFLASGGRSLASEVEAERDRASDALDFERAARLHERVDKMHGVERRRPRLARVVSDLHAFIVENGADPNSVVFFRVWGGEIFGPATLSFDEVASPVPLDQQLQTLLAALRPATQLAGAASAGGHRLSSAARADGARPSGATLADAESTAPPPPWEHLALLARWYYSSFREGEFLELRRPEEIPHARLIRLCRKLLGIDAGHTRQSAG